MDFKRKFALYIILSGFIPGLLFTACTSFFVDPPGDSKITTNDAVLLAEQEIPASGGTLFVQNGGILEGFKIEVPSGSFETSQTISISAAEIKSHDLGQYFNPISPLIKIEYNGGYADSLMMVTIPIALPANHFAMGLYFDEETGMLEGLPVMELTNTYITLATRHFMSGADLHPDNAIKKSAHIRFDASCNLVITSLAETELYNKPIISTGFSPGIDDYEFVNYGSYIAPGGHCAGQSITMMWYYYEKTLLGEPTLYHRFDLLNDPSKPEFMWMDNPNYFRFASVIQQDLDWNGMLFKVLKKIRVTDEYHHLSWKSFILSLLLTGHPQYVGLTSQKGGHAILTHKISPAEGILYVTDPNFPGQEKQIKYENGKFSPYNTMLNSSENNPYAFTGIGYTAVSALIDWNNIYKRYYEVLDSTIGTINPNTFPDYKIWAIEKNVDTDIANADIIPFLINNDTLRCIIECPEAQLSYNIDNKRLISFYFFDENGNQIDIQEKKWQKYTLLKPGWNKLGVFIFAWKEGFKSDETGEYLEQFVDFKWLNIYRSGFKIEPDPIEGQPGEELTLKVVSENTLPSSVRYEWNFGDGNSLSVDNTIEVKHTYLNEGEYTVTLNIFDNSSNELLGKIQTKATISNAQMKVVAVRFKIDLMDVDFLRTDSRYNNGDPQEVTTYDRFSLEIYSGFHNSESTYLNNEYFGGIDNYETESQTVAGDIHVIFYGNHDSLDIYVDQTKSTNGTCPKAEWLDISGPSSRYKTAWTEKLLAEYIGVAFYREDVTHFYPTRDKVIEYEIRLDALDRLNLTFETEGIREDGVSWNAEYLRHHSKERNTGGGSVTVVYEYN